MIPANQTNKVYVSHLLRRQYPRLYKELKATLAEADVVLDQVPGTRSIWIRDCAPLQLSQTRFVQFTYAPAYLKGCPHQITPPQVMSKVLPRGSTYTYSPIVLDGGGIVHATNTAVITTRAYSENPTYTPRKLKQAIQDFLALEKLIVIPEEPGDVFGHADGVLQLIDDHTAVVNDYRKLNPTYGRELKAILKKNRIEVVIVPYTPTARKYRGIPSAEGTYVNYLETSRVVLVPTYRKKSDEEAIGRLQTIFKGRQVTPVDAMAIAREGGSVHCASSNLKTG